MGSTKIGQWNPTDIKSPIQSAPGLSPWNGVKEWGGIGIGIVGGGDIGAPESTTSDSRSGRLGLSLNQTCFWNENACSGDW